MVKWSIVFKKEATKDAKKLTACGLDKNAKKLIQAIQSNPFEPPYEKLVGELSNYYSRRINFKHRLVYSINDSEKIITIIRMWSHFE